MGFNLNLLSKAICIQITNLCNLSCSGCNQLVDVVPANKRFLISLEEFNTVLSTVLEIADQTWNESWYPQRNKYIALYGGEPTIHPEFSAILEICKTHPTVPFVVFTNGRTFPDESAYTSTGYEEFMYLVGPTRPLIVSHDKNIFWRVHRKTPGMKFVTTLDAACDMPQYAGIPHDMFPELAMNHCRLINQTSCEVMIHNGKGYVCDISSAMDQTFGNGSNGWPLSVDMFCKTTEEMLEQLKPFCYRCHYCQPNLVDIDLTLPAVISPTNQEALSNDNTP